MAQCQDTLYNSKPNNDTASGNRIIENRFISINGVEQWITIKGERSKPVIFFLHGGPGSPLSPYAEAIYGEWEKDFIIVHWDQRGSGKTFGINAPADIISHAQSNPLTVQLMATDGIAVVEYLVKYLRKQKVILFGTSWGSVLGVKMAIKRPDLFYAYVGHSQVVNPSEDWLHVYQKVHELAHNAGDQKSLDVLTAIGKPPYAMAKNSGQLLRIVKKYERENSTPVSDSLWKLSLLYDNGKDNQHREDGDDYSFINFAGDKQSGIKSMISTINLLKDCLDFKIPVYLIQGEEDILTPKEISLMYFNMIRAPEKKFMLVPNAAHGFNLSVLRMKYQIMKEYIWPFLPK